MRVTVVRPAELGEAEAAQWVKFQRLSPRGLSPFFSLSYVQAVGRARANARIAIVEVDGKVEAFIPYELTRSNIATPIGGTWTLVDGLIASNRPFDLRLAIKKAGLRGWRFSHAPGEQVALDSYRYHHNYHGTTNSIIDLSNGYDAYINSMSSAVADRVSRTARYRRSLERKVGAVTLHWNTRNLDHLNQLLEWKSAQHESVRSWLSDSKTLGLLQELAQIESVDCSGITSVLFAGDRPIAILLSLKGFQNLGAWITAYDQAFSRFSPGMIKWLAIAEEALNQGVTCIDFGYGQNSYKRRLSNAEYSASGGGVWASRAEAAGRLVYRRVRFR